MGRSTYIATTEERHYGNRPDRLVVPQLTPSNPQLQQRTVGAELARSLGVLSDTALNAATAYEADREKIGIGRAEQLLNSMTTEDMQKKSTIELLAQDTLIADNPYAKAFIDKGRGSYLAALAKEQYQTDVIAKEGYLNTAAAENARFIEYMGNKRNEYLTNWSQGDLTLAPTGFTVDDTTAFDEGYNEAFRVDQMENIRAQGRDKSQEMNIIAASTLNTEMSAAVVSLPTLGGYVPQAADAINKAFTKAAMSGVTMAQRMEAARTMAKDMVTRGYTIRTIEAVMAGTTIGVDSQGKNVQMKDIVPDQELLKVQALTNYHAQYNTDTQELQTQISLMNSAQQQEFFDKMKHDDPNAYLATSPWRETLLKQKQAEERRKSIHEAQGQVVATVKQAVQSKIDMYLSAYLAGNSTAGDGSRVVTAASEIKIPYQTVNASGDVVEATYTATESDMDAALARRLQGADDKTLMKALTWGGASSYVKSIRASALNAWNSLTPDNFKEGGSANSTITKNIKQYRQDANAFAQIYGTELADKVGLAIALSQDNELEGLRLFAQASQAERQAGKDIANQHKTDISNKMQRPELSGFITLAGTETTLRRNIAANQAIWDRISKTAYALSFIQNGTDSVKAATDIVAKSVRVWNGTAIPMSIFDCITQTDAAHKGALGAKALDWLVANWKIQHNVSDTEAAGLSYGWNYNTSKFFIYGANKGQSEYTLGNIQYAAEYVLKVEQQNREVEAANYTAQQRATADVAKAKAAQAQSTSENMRGLVGRAVSWVEDLFGY